MPMQGIRDYILARRRVKLNALYERVYELKSALAGIDYELHPFDYDQIDNDLQHTRQRASALAQKL